MSVIWSGVTEEGAVVPVQVTDEGKVVAVGDGPQGDYLPTSGGNLTGDLTLGTDEITLNAMDGSAEFAGSVKSNDYLWAIPQASNSGLYLEGTNTSSPRAVVIQENSGDPTNSIEINFDGSASFQGRLTVNSDTDLGLQVVNDSVGSASIQAQNIAGGDSAVWQGYNAIKQTSLITSDGKATFAGNVQVGLDPRGGANNGIYMSAGAGEINLTNNANGNVLSIRQNGSATQTASLFASGAATFSGDVVIGSRGLKWLIRESNGVAMLVQQSREAAPMTGVSTMTGASPMIPEKVRDIPSELDLIEMALNEVMEKLRMTPPAGWPVWDGSDNP